MNAPRLTHTIVGILLSCTVLLSSAATAEVTDTTGAAAPTTELTTAADSPATASPPASTTSTPVEGKPETASAMDSKAACQIDCTEPLEACSESKKVIEILKLLADAYARGDLVTYEAYLDDSCTTFDEGTKKLIAGKEAVLAHLKLRFEEFSPTGKTPLVSYKILHPYAKVTGDTAVVTFVAETQIGGKSPYKAENRITDIFVKHGDKWKKLHYRGRWRKVG